MHPVSRLMMFTGSLALASAPASAQSAQSWIAWANPNRLNMPVNACPTTPIPKSQEATNPWFDFNGTFAISGFSCQQIGPFPSLNTPHGPWFMQNVKGLRPNSCASSPCRVNAVRICSLNALHGPNPTGPFGGVVGARGCEGLWSEEVPSTVP